MTVAVGGMEGGHSEGDSEVAFRGCREAKKVVEGKVEEEEEEEEARWVFRDVGCTIAVRWGSCWAIVRCERTGGRCGVTTASFR